MKNDSMKWMDLLKIEKIFKKKINTVVVLFGHKLIHGINLVLKKNVKQASEQAIQLWNSEFLQKLIH